MVLGVMVSARGRDLTTKKLLTCGDILQYEHPSRVAERRTMIFDY